MAIELADDSTINASDGIRVCWIANLHDHARVEKSHGTKKDKGKVSSEVLINRANLPANSVFLTKVSIVVGELDCRGFGPWAKLGLHMLRHDVYGNQTSVFRALV